MSRRQTPGARGSAHSRTGSQAPRLRSQPVVFPANAEPGEGATVGDGSGVIRRRHGNAAPPVPPIGAGGTVGVPAGANYATNRNPKWWSVTARSAPTKTLEVIRPVAPASCP